MSSDPIEVPAMSAYRTPEIVTVGRIAELTGAGGPKVVDAYGPDGHTANDWNIHNSQGDEPDDEIGADVLA